MKLILNDALQIIADWAYSKSGETTEEHSQAMAVVLKDAERLRGVDNMLSRKLPHLPPDQPPHLYVLADGKTLLSVDFRYGFIAISRVKTNPQGFIRATGALRFINIPDADRPNDERREPEQEKIYKRLLAAIDDYNEELRISSADRTDKVSTVVKGQKWDELVSKRTQEVRIGEGNRAGGQRSQNLHDVGALTKRQLQELSEALDGSGGEANARTSAIRDSLNRMTKTDRTRN